MLPQKITGVVTKFKGDGRKLGYPTANIIVDSDLGDGVYFGHTDLKEYMNHPSLIFMGTPTTMGETEHRVEVHLLDIPDRDYYDETLAVNIEHFHRANLTFESTKALQEVMRDDETQAREYFSSGNARP